jgi:outer membrane protein OmpA-like peptidoglycan-associated protein
MSDVFEKANGFDLNDPSDAVSDKDEDGLSNVDEMILGTEPSKVDSDGDGQSDAAEKLALSNPMDKTSKYVDSDGDGMSDVFEKANGFDSSSPSDASADKDGDGLSNYDEMIAGTDLSDPLSKPIDDIGLTNGSDDSVKEIKEKDGNGTINSSPSIPEFSFNTGDDVYYFKYGSFYVNRNNLQLNNLAKELKNNKTINVKLIGHTDNAGSEALNMNLSKYRASTVYDFLVSKGVSVSQISFQGLGESSPKYPNTNEENKRKNRRVEIKY